MIRNKADSYRLVNPPQKTLKFKFKGRLLFSRPSQLHRGGKPCLLQHQSFLLCSTLGIKGSHELMGLLHHTVSTG